MVVLRQIVVITLGPVSLLLARRQACGPTSTRNMGNVHMTLPAANTTGMQAPQNACAWTHRRPPKCISRREGKPGSQNLASREQGLRQRIAAPRRKTSQKQAYAHARGRHAAADPVLPSTPRGLRGRAWPSQGWAGSGRRRCAAGPAGTARGTPRALRRTPAARAAVRWAARAPPPARRCCPARSRPIGRPPGTSPAPARLCQAAHAPLLRALRPHKRRPQAATQATPTGGHRHA